MPLSIFSDKDHPIEAKFINEPDSGNKFENSGYPSLNISSALVISGGGGVPTYDLNIKVLQDASIEKQKNSADQE